MNIPTEGLERDFALVLKKEFLAISKQTNQVDFFPSRWPLLFDGCDRVTRKM